MLHWEFFVPFQQCPKADHGAPRDSSSPRPSVPVPSRVWTRTRGAAARFLETVYGGNIQHAFDSETAGFSASFCALRIGQLRLVKTGVTSLRCQRYSDTMVQLVVVLNGALRQQTEGMPNAIVATKDTIAVVPPYLRTIQECSKGQAIVLSLPITVLQRKYEELSGRPQKPDWACDIVRSIDPKSAAGVALTRNAKCAVAELLTLQEEGMFAVVEKAYEDLLSNLATAALFPNVNQTVGQRSDRAPSSVIAAARDYIAEHAAERILVADLAATLNINIRTLQMNFRKEYGLSPRDFLVQCRVERARNTLLSGGFGLSVTEIAFNSGFSDLSHFTQNYRRRYGEAPHKTLRTGCS